MPALPPLRLPRRLQCPNCEAELGYHLLTRQFYGVRNGQVVIDGQTWYTCSNREWDCNWLVREDAPAGRCFSCRLTRTAPAADDTVALEKLAKTEEAKRRLLAPARRPRTADRAVGRQARRARLRPDLEPARTASGS